MRPIIRNLNIYAGPQLQYSPKVGPMSWAQGCNINLHRRNILCFPYDMYITETDPRDERFDVKQNIKLNKIYDKSLDKYLKGQQVIMELHTPSSQKNAAQKNAEQRSLSSATIILKREERFHISRFGTSLPSLIGLVSFVYVSACG